MQGGYNDRLERLVSNYYKDGKFLSRTQEPFLVVKVRTRRDEEDWERVDPQYAYGKDLGRRLEVLLNGEIIVGNSNDAPILTQD